MMTNQLSEAKSANSVILGRRSFAVGRGFGLGVAIVLEPDQTAIERRGSQGTVSWPGAFGGRWLADPKKRTIFILLAHNMVDLPQMAKGIGVSVWTTIDQATQAALGWESQIRIERRIA